MNISVFCSANDNLAATYQEAAARLGRWMAREGHTLVFGGCALGLMDIIGRTVHQAGGRTIGVVPRIIEETGRESPFLSVTIPCEDLSDRKQLMLVHSDVAVALPGGLGTLDEIFSVVAGATIGYHSQRVVLYNLNGFWNPLIALLDSLEKQGLMRRPWRHHLAVADTFDQLTARLTALQPPGPAQTGA